MAYAKEEAKIPTFDGSSGEAFKRYETSVKWLAAATPADKRELLAARLIGKLSGQASILFADDDPDVYSNREGINLMLNKLRENYGHYSDHELVTSIRGFFYNNKKAAGESVTQFTARYKTSLSRLASLVDEELARQSLKEHQKAMAVFREQLLDHHHAVRLIRARQAAGEEVEVPDDPVEPEAVAPGRFQLPDVVTGTLYTTALGLSPGLQAQIIRVSGSVSISSVEKMLRTAETPLIQAPMARPPLSRGRHWSYVAHDTGWSGNEWTEEDEGEDVGMESHEDVLWTEDMEGEEEEDDFEDDPEFEEAMITYKQARGHLSSIRKARGFHSPASLPPGQMHQKGIGKSSGKRKGKGKGKRSGKSKGRTKGKRHAPGTPPANQQHRSMRIEHTSGLRHQWLIF
jgi:hypothetical protein